MLAYVRFVGLIVAVAASRFLPPVLAAVAALLWFSLLVGAFTRLGPTLGFRPAAWTLVFVPFLGFFFVVTAMWRLCWWPYRYWSWDLKPAEWTVVWRLWGVVGVVIAAVFLLGALLPS